MSKRKAGDAPSVVNNITYNINNYFSRKAGPTDAPPAPTGPVNLFPNDERRNYKYTAARKRQSISSTSSSRRPSPTARCRVAASAAPRASCPSSASHRWRATTMGATVPPFSRRSPTTTRRTPRATWTRPGRRGDAWRTHRHTRCPPCAVAAGTLSPAKQACKDEWERMRKEACAAQRRLPVPGVHRARRAGLVRLGGGPRAHG